MLYAIKAWEIVGYTYQADVWCPDDIRELYQGQVESLDGKVGQEYDHLSAEEILDRVAFHQGIDRQDERTFDSGDFPKVVFASMVESDEERCGQCHEALIG